MELKRCRLCDNVFATPGPDICPQCWTELDEIYAMARTAIRDHRDEHMDAARLSEIIKVDQEYIDILVDQGFLELKPMEDDINRCRSCGAEIIPGQNYCDECKAKLLKGFAAGEEHKKKTMFRQERRSKKEKTWRE